MERLIPVREEGYQDSLIDLSQLNRGLSTDGVLLDDLLEHRGVMVAPGVTLSTYIRNLTTFHHVGVEDTEGGQVLKYMNIDAELNRLERIRGETSRQAMQILEERGIIPPTKL